MQLTLAAVGQYIISGLTAGSVYALIAVGFTMVYNTCDIVNFAQGEFAMLGGMLAVAIAGGLPLPLWIAVILAILAVSLLAGLCALSAIYPLRRVSPLGLIIITIGLSIVLRGAAMLIWGKDYRPLDPFFQGAYILHLPGGLAVLQRQTLAVLAAASAISVLLYLFFKFTNIGRAMRASAANRRGARICGIEPRRIMVLAFILSGAIGAIGGIVIAPITMAGYDMGIMLGLKGFCGAIVGGLSSLPGAVAGGLVLGLLEALGAGLISTHIKEILAFVALLGILYLRPAGLFGRREA